MWRRRSGTGSPRPAGPRRSANAALADVEAKARAGQRRQRHAVAGEARRHRAVEEVDPERDPVEQVVGLADAEQVLRRLRRKHGARSSSSTPCISGLSRPSVPPIASPSTAAAETALGRLAAQVLVDAALDDPEHGLAARARARSCQSRQRSSQRWVRSVERAV